MWKQQENTKMKKKIHILKNLLQVQLMSFYHIIVEIIRKCGYIKKIKFGKKYASLANEFLLHPAAIRKLKIRKNKNN